MHSGKVHIRSTRASQDVPPPPHNPSAQWQRHAPDEVEEGVQGGGRLGVVLLQLDAFFEGLVTRVDGHDQDDTQDDGEEGGAEVVDDGPQPHLARVLGVQVSQTCKTTAVSM